MNAKVCDKVLIRYWGSRLKEPLHAKRLASLFMPLAVKNWQIHLVLERLPEDPSWLKPFAEMGVGLETAPRPRRQFDWRCIANTYHLCRRVHPSVIHCDNLHTSPMIGAALAGVPVRLWSKRAMNPNNEECRPPSFRERIALSTRVTIRIATRVIAVSGSVKDELVQMGIPADRILVRCNPKRLGLSADKTGRETSRKQLGCDKSEVVILTIGHAVPVKGWDLLLRAFSRVAEVEPRARLILVGSFNANHERAFYTLLESYVAEQKLANKVIFTGHVEDIGPVLKAADLFVMPSRSEGFSQALIEALQAGLPCIATRVGIAEDVIEDGVNGFLVGRGDEGGLAQAMLRLAQEEGLRKQLAQNAVVPACIPTLQEYAENLACDYESLLAMSASHRCTGL
jgi:glycosyltransferase involved in cell wall biosynthesis